MDVKLLATGGTIDATGIRKGKKIFDKTHIHQMLNQARLNSNPSVENLMLKLSYEITDEDRKKILKACKNCKQKKIIITHGTDSIIETAKLLGKNIKNKTIILTGAIIPYRKKNQTLCSTWVAHLQQFRTCQMEYISR